MSVVVQMLWGERRGHMAPSALLRSTVGVPPCRNIVVLTQAGPSPLKEDNTIIAVIDETASMHAFVCG